MDPLSILGDPDSERLARTEPEGGECGTMSLTPDMELVREVSRVKVGGAGIFEVDDVASFELVIARVRGDRTAGCGCGGGGRVAGGELGSIGRRPEVCWVKNNKQKINI